MGIFLVPLVASLDIQTRTLRESPNDYILFERIVTRDGFTLQTKTISDTGSVSYSSQDFTLNGVPVHTRQEGYWNDRWNIFETHYRSSGATQAINDEVTKSKLKASRFRNASLLWFWKTHPAKGTSVTVDFLAQNTIATFKIKFTYEGDEKARILGRDVTLHRVHEKPLGAPDAVYTTWWYDDHGMGVKRYHKTTENEYWYDLVAWR